MCLVVLYNYSVDYVEVQSKCYGQQCDISNDAAQKKCTIQLNSCIMA